MVKTERSKGTIRLSLKDSKVSLEKNKSKRSLIMLHFSYGNMRFKYSTGYYSSFNEWDFKKQRVRNKTTIKNSDDVNDLLGDMETCLSREVTRLESEQEIITKKHLKYFLDDFLNKTIEEKETEVSLYSYIDTFLTHKEGKIQDVTLRSYKQTKRLLLGFNKSLNFEDINLDFYYSFISFLEEEDFSLNTIGKHIKNLKSFLKSAFEKGHNKNLSYTNSEFKAPKELTTAIYLTNEGIEKIRILNLSKYPKLDCARDIFIIGCCTGQRVSDYNGLTTENIFTIDGLIFFKIKQQKTNKEVLCPITKEIKEILDKQRNEGKPPKKMNEQDLNDCIKQIGQMAKINDLVQTTRTKGGKTVNSKVYKYDLICTHTARRTFCTNKYKIGMPIYDIMVFSGHSTEKEFYKYIRIEKEQQAIKLAKSKYFNT